MHLKQLFGRIVEFTVKMLTSPRHFWDDVSERKVTIRVFRQFYLPFVIFVSLTRAIGDLLNSPEILISYTIITGLKEAFVYVIHFFIMVFVLNRLTTVFGGKENTESSRLAIGFSITPFFLMAVITGLFPFLYVLNVLGLYGLYIFYTGVPKLFGIPKSRIISFSVTAILANFVIFAVLSIIFWNLLGTFYY